MHLNPGVHFDGWKMPCTGHNTLILFNPLDKAGETEAQLENGEESMDEYKYHHGNLGQSLPSQGWRLQGFLEESDAGVGGELPHTRKQTTTRRDLGQHTCAEGKAGETGAQLPPF